MNKLYHADQDTNPPEYQDEAAQQMRTLAIQEGWCDSKGNPQPEDACLYDDNVMQCVQYVFDEGSVQFNDRGPLARKLADQLNYKSTANCVAMLRECVKQGLLSVGIQDGAGVLMHTAYGREQVLRWEDLE